MKNWMKILIAFVGSGSIGALTFMASLYPAWGGVLSYATLAISGTMSIIISWPPKTT